MFTQIMEQMRGLKLGGCITALQEQLSNSSYQDLPFDQRLAMLLEREQLRRQNLRLAKRLKAAQLKQNAIVEQVDFHTPRQLSKAQFLELANCGWVQSSHNLFITGPTGVGKSYLACALADKACRQGFSVLYQRAADLYAQLLLARASGTYPDLALKLAKTKLLLIDEWLRDPLSEVQAREVLDLLDDRYGQAATAFISQVPVSDWHANIAAPTIADALLDRIVHNAIRIELRGESMRKLAAKKS